MLLANEAGSGRGHVVKLANTALALQATTRAPLQFAAGLARLTHADELSRHGVKIHAAPPLGYTKAALADPASEGNATWGDYLAAIGLARAAQIRTSLQFWRDLIVAEDVSLLVADYAPFAMLAARGLRAQGWQIEVISVGTGYGVPPADLAQFPQLLPDYPRSLHPEPQLLAQLNAVMADFAFPPLGRLPEIYAASLALPATLGFLDPYRSFRGPDALVPPQVDVAPDLAGGGDEVFVYFSTSELADPDLIAALTELPLPRRGFLPGVKPETRDRLTASGMIVETAPVAVEAISARSRLMLHSAQHGILCLAAFAGLPQIALPQHLEHVFHGRRAGQQGILDQLELRERSKPALLDMLQSAYASAPLQARAQDFARALRAEAPKDSAALLQARLAPVLSSLT